MIPEPYDDGYAVQEPLSSYSPPPPQANPVLPPARNTKFGERLRGKRQAWAAHPGIDGLFINVNHEPQGVYGGGREDHYGR